MSVPRARARLPKKLSDAPLELLFLSKELAEAWFHLSKPPKLEPGELSVQDLLRWEKKKISNFFLLPPQQILGKNTTVLVATGNEDCGVACSDSHRGES